MAKLIKRKRRVLHEKSEAGVGWRILGPKELLKKGDEFKMVRIGGEEYRWPPQYYDWTPENGGWGTPVREYQAKYPIVYRRRIDG